MPAFTIIADDLTGACDTGAVFARAGWRTLVVLDMQRDRTAVSDDVDVLVYSTESRHLPVAQAIAVVEHAAQRVKQNRLKPRPPESPISTLQSQLGVWAYKKIDSTLRGHPGEELAALMGALDVEQALVAPAFPAQGRITLNAQLLVDGQPLSATPFASDVTSGDLRTVFKNDFCAVHGIGLDAVRAGVMVVAQCMRAQPGILLADAQTDDDLVTLASAAQKVGIRLLCGSAGLARALTRVVGTHYTANEAAEPVGPFLVIAGSRNAATVRQIEATRVSGTAVIDVPPEFGQPNVHHIESQSLVARQAQAVITAGRDAIVTAAAMELSPLGKDVIAHRLGAMAAQVLAGVTPGTLVLTGGDIATAVCAALGANGITLLGELQPGIAFGRLADGAYAGLCVVTKAGGFGRAESLLEIIRGIGD